MSPKKAVFIQIIVRKETPLFLILFIAGLSLFGWVYGKNVLTSYSSLYIPIAPLTAFMFIAVCLLFLSNVNIGKSRSGRLIATLLLLFVVLTSLMIFLKYLLNFTWDIEKIFINNPENLLNVPKGRMSPISSVLFVFICMGIWGIRQNYSIVIKYFGGGFSLAVFLVSSVLLIGYLYKAPLLYGSQIIPVALPSAICFLLFSFTLLRVYELQFWTFNRIKGNTITRQLLKWFLPIVIFIVVFQGFLITRFSINQENQKLDDAFILLIITIITIVAIIRVSAILGVRILKVEKALSKSEGRFKTMIEESPLGIALIDSVTDRILEVNPMFTQIAGRTQEQMITLGWTTIIHPDDRQEELDKMTLLNAGKINGFQMEKRLLRPDDTIVWINMTIAPLNFDDIDNPRQLCMIEDITERIQTGAEIKLKNEQLHAINATKDKFFSIIAHDLRSPLGSFMQLTEMMADDSRDFTPEDKKDLTLTMSHSARNIFNLLNNLLEWSLMQKGQTSFTPQTHNLKETVTESLKVVIESAGNKTIEITVDIPDELKVFADTNMLQLIIRNLVSNAVKFTPQGGRVIISAAAGENNTAVIAVKDSGIGMSKKMQDHLFSIDTKSSRSGTDGERGTGLGLLLCKEFIEKHGGKIWVESEEGKGSTFYFSLPSNNAPKTIKNH